MAGNIEQSRKIEDVRLSANAAGLVSSGPVQLLKFSENCMADEYKLLELPLKLLEKLQQGESLVIRGESQEDAVLCTKDNTYEIKLADTSNALLLTPGCQINKDPAFKEQTTDLVEHQVCSCHSEYYEVRSGRPHLHKLHNLLRESVFKGAEYETKEIENDSIRQSTKYSIDDLLNLVQASENEIWSALEKLGAIAINGYWRLLDVDYEEKVVINILNLLEEKDWDWKNVPLEECCEVLKELEPREIIEHCFNRYGKRVNEEDQSVVYSLNEDKICQFYAQYLLRPADRFNYYEFMDSWQQSVPEGMTTKSDQLAGVALTEMRSHPPVIWYFPYNDLPEKPDMRFMKLFKIRQKWTFEEIQPYIRDLADAGQSLNALLLKYTRSSKDDTGTKVFSSKKPV